MIRTALIGTPQKLENYTRAAGRSEAVVLSTRDENPFDNQQILNHAFDTDVIIDPLLLPDSADAVIFTSKEKQTFDVVRDILKNARHVLLYPDPKLPFHQLEKLIRIAEEAGVLLYMAHHFLNTTFLDTSRKFCNHPEFISIYSHCNGSHTVNAKHIREVLYFDIISILSVNRVSIRKYALLSVPFNAPNPLLITVRLEFTNGSSAALTLNQYADHDSKILEIFSSDAMIRSDSRKEIIEIRQSDLPYHPGIRIKNDVQDINLKEDLTAFFQLIRKRSFPADQYIAGIITHKIATEIVNRISTDPA